MKDLWAFVKKISKCILSDTLLKNIYLHCKLKPSKIKLVGSKRLNMGLHIVNEANKCLQCKKPLCSSHCPITTSIPQVISLFKEGKIMEAGEILFENNPLSLVCSIVCDHEAQCLGNCIMNRKNNPVRFCDIEKFISDFYLDRMEFVKKPRKNVMVAVIGGGPAGMTVSIKMIKEGYDVTIFDEKNTIGGVLQYGIPEFRLPKSLMQRYYDKMEKMGIKIRNNTAVGGALEIKDLFRDGYKAVFVGTGVWRAKTLGIAGESMPNVHFSVDYLANPDGHKLGDSVAIIGMGNAAMDVARTALRRGSRTVKLYARSKRVAANSVEVEAAKYEGAEFIFGKAIEAITYDGPVFKTAIFDEEDNVIDYEKELDYVDADSTIISVSNGPKNKLVLTTDGLRASDKGLLIVDENCMTTVEGVFAAGDVVHGSKTVVDAVAQAKVAVEGMLNYLENL